MVWIVSRGEAGVDFEAGAIRAALVAAPVVGHLDEHGLFADGGGFLLGVGEFGFAVRSSRR
jgi:hypothetical protein